MRPLETPWFSAPMMTPTASADTSQDADRPGNGPAKTTESRLDTAVTKSVWTHLG
ncbi:hypothetical protein [Asanoa sp. NPDC050611]|uniref:hypothetical protein n=1 Tax=Asanoa sp. NPDC050611 TaxID=3157098 RepID=UPI0033D2D762